MSRRWWTLRTQLMLLYAVPFAVSGALLLTGAMLAGRESVPVGTPGAVVPPDAETGRFPVVIWAVAVAAFVLVSFVLGRLVAGRFLRPVRAITATARDISASDLHRRLGDVGGAGEFAELAATLDELFQRLEGSFASQRQFIANASHELRTPLTAERTVLQVALADPHATVESLRESCQQVLLLGAAQERLIEALFALAGGQQGVERKEPFDLAGLARTVLRGRPHPGLTVETSLGAAPASGDPRLVESLIANLVDNAVRHNLPAGGRVEVTTAGVADGARLVVRNTGPIVPPAEMDRLFEPFQQLHRARTGHGDGHGLGLAIVRAIATAHGAALVARARPAGGMDIEVTFP
ncbi:ATP-binding protein [Actinoplanes sp. NEAU-A12]|uniref:histidine kinase n=1 Tax=Actinoplanes sandaracinus TaxID=3045177 RepID=A0ABT6WHZ8_9ACTN|nr:ATP-binding protein [Actinoplanes sandaracinus]MDI6099343.1 ATP-binding protein [Actinoplanes sandaracinus]